VPYSLKLVVFGSVAPYTVAQVGGRLPVGLSFDSTTFMVTGTPAESGFFNAVFRFTDAFGETLQQTHFFSISDAPSTIVINTGCDRGTIMLGAFYSNQLFPCSYTFLVQAADACTVAPFDEEPIDAQSGRGVAHDTDESVGTFARWSRRRTEPSLLN
jgi:hypothetical protein